MKKHRIFSIFIAFCLIITSSFVNITSAATVEYFDELTTDEMLLSELIYDDYILKQKCNEKIDIKKYKEFYNDCIGYIERGEIMYGSLTELNLRLSTYKLKIVKRDIKTGFEGAVFERIYKGKRHLTVVFRGTEMDKSNDVIGADLGEVILNVHANQRNGAQNLVKSAIKLSTNKNPVDEISITGHSLGGFLAQSIGVEIKNNNINMSGIDWRVSTFNAPGFGVKHQEEVRKYKNYSKEEIDEYLDYVNNLDKSTKSYSNITNYIISGDRVSTYGLRHLGKEVIYGNNEPSWTEYHSLYNFHKYGNWYKTSLSKAVIKSVYENDEEVKGIAPANKKVELYINNKPINQTRPIYTNNRGEYKFDIKPQSVGTKIEVKFINSLGNKVSTSIKVKNPLKANKIYYGKKTITGETIPYGKVNVYKVEDALDSNNSPIASTTADEKGNFTITLPKTYPAGTTLEITVRKKFYPQKNIYLNVLKSDISTLTLNKIYSEGTSLSGKTISGAKVTAYVGSKKIGSTVTADKNGNFKINIPKQSTGTKIKVIANKTNYNNKENIVTVTKSPTVNLTYNPKYYNSNTISGKTTAGATVEAYYGNTKLGKVTADKSGNFKINTNVKVPVGKIITVRASKTNYYSKQIQIKVLKSKIFNLSTSDFYTYSTTISGKTTAGATVKAYISNKQVGKTATADKNGNYKITGIKKQSSKKVITVSATKNNYISKSVNVIVKEP